MQIILLGSNPSQASPDNSAFHMSTRSRIIIDGWFEGMDVPDRVYLNVSNTQKVGNKPLSNKEIREACPGLEVRLRELNDSDIRVVTLGKAAAKAMNILNLPHFEMPHPSGRNRLLNDPNYIVEKIKGLREYLRPLNN